MTRNKTSCVYYKIDLIRQMRISGKKKSLYSFIFVLTHVLIFVFLYSSKRHSNQKGLLPEPNPVQIMKSLNNPAMLQILLQPQLCGRTVKPGKHHVY